MTSYHFYCIFFVRSESLGHIQEEAVTQGHGYQEVGIIGGYLEDAFHSPQAYFCKKIFGIITGS